MRRAIINSQDRALFFTVLAFLRGRLEERATIDWALILDTNDFIKREAILNLVNDADGQKLNEPWKSAWRLIEEFWSNPTIDEHLSADEYELKTRIDSGDRSGSLVIAISNFVAPKLKIEKFSDIHIKYNSLPKRIKTIKDLFSVSITSGKIAEPDQFGINHLTDKSFLLSLAQALDNVIANGLDIAHRLGWDESDLWRLGQLHRVYFVPQSDRGNGEYEPDEFHDGIAPSTKLLYTVVSRLADIDLNASLSFVQRWKTSNSPVYLRLWAAMSRDIRLMPSNELGKILLSINNDYFWDVSHYPEISEVRAKRFNSFSSDIRIRLIKRIRKGPPRSFWAKKADPEQVKQYKLYTIVSEIHRICLAGAELPDADLSWLVLKLIEFPEIGKITSVESDFHKAPQANWVAPNPDNQFDMLSGQDRLNALEKALSIGHRNWNDKPSDRAADWIRDKQNVLLVLNDFKEVEGDTSMYPNVWEYFGWNHSPNSNPAQPNSTISRNLADEAVTVETLLLQLDFATLQQAINGISHWVLTWAQTIKDDLRINSLWEKLWPIAVETTNSMQRHNEEPDLNTVAKSNNSEPMDLDTLNTPAGKLTELFLRKCFYSDGANRFDIGAELRRIADEIVLAPGRSGLIGKHRMIEQIHLFVHLNKDWTCKYLISPLLEDDVTSLALWRALARRTLFLDVLEIIGNEVVKRINDTRLGRSTRQSLLFSLVLECLYSFYEQRDPAIPYPIFQQMIRSLEDEIRVHGIQTLQRYVIQQNNDLPGTPEERFRLAVVPFLKEVWPQERSLTTPGISKALADLPAASGQAFVEAVEVLERFLVPFPCWSMIDYGLYGEVNGIPKLSIIDSAAKACALLKLLDLTVGTSETSTIPYDLSSVLDQIQKISPKIAENYIFRRLSTAARRN